MTFRLIITGSLLGILFGSAPAVAGKVSKKTKQPKGTVVELSTRMGKIHIKLYPKKAPQTVANFLRYVRAGFYNGTIFHRVIDNFMIQGGGFTAQMQQKTTRAAVQNEADNGLKNARYTLAMARTSNPHSATAQFFINVKNNGFLNFKSKTRSGWGYCVFGKVIKGTAVVDRIKKVPTGTHGPYRNVPTTPVVITKARIVK
jgi:cyclophilin family peptidyl-prolyl cis-trans isomerase